MYRNWRVDDTGPLRTTLPSTWIAIFGVFAAGGLAGASSWLSVYPVDVLKSRIQVLGGVAYDHLKSFGVGQSTGLLVRCSCFKLLLINQMIRWPVAQATSAADSHFSSWVDCAHKSYREEGAGVFVRGLSATLTRAFVVSAVIFSVYEGALDLLSYRPVAQTVA